MLGEDYATIHGCGCGEIDIMDTTIYGTLHYPVNQEETVMVVLLQLPTQQLNFMFIKAIWSPASVKLYVDDVLFHTVVK
jgi:hypothetical protein